MDAPQTKYACSSILKSGTFSYSHPRVIEVFSWVWSVPWWVDDKRWWWSLLDISKSLSILYGLSNLMKIKDFHRFGSVVFIDTLSFI